MFQLRYQNRVFSLPEDFQNLEPTAPNFVKDAFSFCNAWRSGEENFSQQTSGSTGLPKQITIQRNQFKASAMGTGRFFNAKPEWKLLCCLDPGYIAGKMMLVRAMEWECEIELLEASKNPFESLPEADSYDLVAMVPMQVEAILTNPKTDLQLKKIKNLLIGGADISPDLRTQLVEMQLNAFQSFGMTETVSHFALAKITSESLIYQCLPGVTIGANEANLLWVISEMSGPQKIQTSDQVEILSSNTFKWLGRADFVINSGGVKLHPEVLEQKSANLIRKHFPNSAFFFGSEPDSVLGEKLVLFIESRLVGEKNLSNLHSELRLSLSRFEMPREIKLIPDFHRTATGKIDRIKTSRTK